MGTLPQSNCDFDTCLTSNSPYGYRPALIANAVFLTIFTICLISCIALTIIRRKWLSFGILMCLTCAMEVIGYASRIGGYNNPWNVKLYVMAQAFITVAPDFVAAA
jgi:hypothetical protein